MTQAVYDGHFDEPKTQRSKRTVPLGAKSVEILSARKPAGVNPEALVFATRTGTPFEPHNLSNRQLRPICRRLGLVGVGWHWLRHANATLLDAVRCRLPKLDRASVEAAFAATLSVDVADQRFIAKINQHGMVLTIEPAAEDIKTPVSRPG